MADRRLRAAPFRGGPACVVEPFDAWPDTAWTQDLAGELAQPETAFLRRTAASARFGIRWFTPTTEAPLCGHATLAAAHVLIKEMREDPPGFVVTFESRDHGALRASSQENRYRLDFPADAPRRIATPAGLEAALGAAPRETWAGKQYLCALLADESEVRRFRPDFAALSRVSYDEGYEQGSLIVAALADADRPYEVVSRFFAPLLGIPEDPVTGSAHCMLMPLFAARLGRTALKFHQAHPLRGGDLECEINGDRVLLIGRAVTMADVRLRSSAAPPPVQRSSSSSE